ncbi:hypothetical protein [Aneurinibacillus aneurinilyticus]|jgi:hypothetical protein|nr:hypothetical protein [Aneurinibacillus aneurinilyticus]
MRKWTLFITLANVMVFVIFVAKQEYGSAVLNGLVACALAPFIKEAK